MDANTIESVVGRKFLRKKSHLGEKEKETLYNVEECGTDEFLGAKFLLLFFSANWCPPCEHFLQVLKDFYNEVNIDSKNVEVIYVSSDKTEQEFKDSYARMPWITVSYNNSFHADLRNKFEINGIPFVFVLDAQTGFLISKKGRKDISELGVGCMKHWETEFPLQVEKKKHLDWGASVVEAAKKAAEEEARKKKEAEREND